MDMETTNSSSSSSLLVDSIECGVSEFMQVKLEKDAKKNWDLFYKRNGDRFFKDRHWTTREFTELIENDKQLVLVEIGCGVGNFIFPLLETSSNIFAYGCDFSPVAIDLCVKNATSKPSAQDKCDFFVADITSNVFMETFSSCARKHYHEQVDLVSLIFVLSAIHPDKMRQALTNVFSILKPGGLLIFRDYALNDYAMSRFSSSSRIKVNFCVRQDGTRAYYFSKEETELLFTSVGFHIVDNDYVTRNTVNVKEAVSLERLFLQAKLLKPEK